MPGQADFPANELNEEQDNTFPERERPSWKSPGVEEKRAHLKERKVCMPEQQQECGVV